MQINEGKPPYVTFEVRQVEDRQLTLERGHWSSKDVIFAIITPQGSKDRFEKEAETWIKDIEQAVQEDRFNPMWLVAYKQRYADFLAGREIPEDGTPIITWPAIGPSQQKAILDANIRTIEDLANANEATLTAIGMGARALKEKAQAWLDTAQDQGKVAGELEKLRKQNADLTDRNLALEKEVAKLKVLVEAKEDA